MKKVKYLILSLVIFLSYSLTVNAASNELYNLDINVKINNDASADITEIWTMKVGKGTEVYKPMSNLRTSSISNFKVKDETGRVYTNISWNVNASLTEKKYKSGINYTSDGLELCWGMGSYGKHTYTISYHVTNFVRNLSDSQMVYWKLVNDSMNPAPDKVKIILSSDKYFDDTLDVWGYGYKGYAYVSEGKIYMETDGVLDSSEYMVLLVKFKPSTFNATAKEEGTFNYWYKISELGTFNNRVNELEKEYDYSNEQNKFQITDILGFIIPILALILWLTFLLFFPTSKIKMTGIKLSKEDKKIAKKTSLYFRDIPCNGNIYRAYFISLLFGLTKKEEKILGAVLLKWLNENKIEFIETRSTIFGKKKKAIDLKKNETKVFSNEYEQKLYDMLSLASDDGVLETKDIKKGCSRNYVDIFYWLENIIAYEKGKLVQDGSLIQTEKFVRGIFRRKKIICYVHPSLRQEAAELAGLKKFLIDFSNMKDKETIEVHLWKEYLIFAQIFGIANKVTKQFKNLYPDLTAEMDYSDILTLNSITKSAMTYAYRARNIGTSHSSGSNYSGGYSSGGGGYSSGGGGSGSFGGGSGGGCR